MDDKKEMSGKGQLALAKPRSMSCNRAVPQKTKSKSSKLRLAPARFQERAVRARADNTKKSGLRLASGVPLERNQDGSGTQEAENKVENDGPGTSTHFVEGPRGVQGVETDLEAAGMTDAEIELTEDIPTIEGVLAPTSKETRDRLLEKAVEATGVHALPSKRRHTWITTLIVIAILILAAVGAIAGVLLSRSKGGGVATTAPTTAPTDIPTAVPKSSRLEEVLSLVETSFGTNVIEPLSPSYKAAMWIADIDTTFSTFSPDTVNENRFRQRYALAVFYYATGGDTSWELQANFMSPVHHECDWNQPAEKITYISDTLGVQCRRTFAGIRSVTHLELNQNNLTGSLPEELYALSSLAFLILIDNNLEGSLPSTLFELSELIVLSTAYNNLMSGSLSTEIGRLTNLKALWFEDTSFDSTVPSEIGNLSQLTFLNLANNSLAGSILENLVQLSKLEQLYLNDNSLTGSLPRSFPSSWKNLTTLDVTDNNLNWTLPDDIGSLSLLKELGLSYNRFSGRIPSSIVNLRSLVALQANDNYFTGELPQNWSHLSKTLRNLVLQNNRLSGSLTSSLGTLTTLDVALGLWDNSLTGTIPEELGNLTHLRALLLGGNSLIGSIPESFQKLTSLEILHLYENLLTGEVPFLCDGNEMILPALVQLYADCFDEVTCPCCNGCCDADGNCDFVNTFY